MQLELPAWQQRLSLLICFWATFVGTGCETNELGVVGVRFTTVMEGIEYAHYRQEGSISGKDFRGNVFRLDLRKVDMRVLPAGGPGTRREVEEIVRAIPLVIAVNGSFFDEDGKAMGIVVDQGRLISRYRKKSWGALVISDSTASLMKGSEVNLGTNPDIVLQGQPRLVVNGKMSKLKRQVAKRVALCLEAEGRDTHHQNRLVIVTASEVDAQDFASFLALPRGRGGLGCLDALNLDGGPSAQLLARLRDVRVQTPGGDAVPNALVAIPAREKSANEPTGSAQAQGKVQKQSIEPAKKVKSEDS